MSKTRNCLIPKDRELLGEWTKARESLLQYESQSFRWPGDYGIMESYARICAAVKERASPPLRKRIAEAEKELAARAQRENSRKSMQILAGKYWLAD